MTLAQCDYFETSIMPLSANNCNYNIDSIFLLSMQIIIDNDPSDVSHVCIYVCSIIANIMYSL